MFREALFEPGRGFGRKAAALPLALLVHAVVAALLVTIPLIRTPRLPEVDLTAVFLAPPPPLPPSAPPKGSGSGSRSGKKIESVKTARLASPGRLLVPTEIPSEISAERISGGGVGWGIEGGVPDDTGAAWNEVYPEWLIGPVLPEDDVPLRAGGKITLPKLVRRVDPDYPEIARRARVEGTVILEATTDAAGRVIDVAVLRSIPLLDGAAIDAVRRWIYEPMVVNGRPRPVTFTVTVRFELR